jgi:lipopolysaccharide transport system permease protein
MFVRDCVKLMTTTNQMNAVLPTIPAEHENDRDDTGPAEIVTVIRPRPGWIAINWGELIQAHELFSTLVARDIMVRYKQSVLGVAWAVIQPVLTMVVFSVIFGRFVGLGQQTAAPYPLWAYAGLVFWTFFSNSTTGSSLSLLNQQNLLTKIYFPRLYVPGAVIGSYLVDLAIGLSLFVILMPIYRFWPTWNLLALPLVILLTFAATLGIGLSLAAMTLLYRDLRFVVPFALQLLIYVSGVIVPMESMKPMIRYIAALNPIFGVVSASRSSILGMAWDFGPLAVSVVSTAAILIFGLFFFRKTERLIADIV